jgi:hypothetical protein
MMLTTNSDNFPEQRSVRFEALSAGTMKIAVFWDVTPCSVNRQQRFGGI